MTVETVVIILFDQHPVICDLINLFTLRYHQKIVKHNQCCSFNASKVVSLTSPPLGLCSVADE